METLVTTLIAFVAIFIVYLSLMVTYHTIRSDCFEKQQKSYIVALAWLVPIIGPAITLVILNQDKPMVKKPGIPLFEFIFLAAVVNHVSSAESGSHEVSSHDLGGFGGGDGGDGGGSGGD
jgi:Ni/Fe-hydrogenase subunit HybB-like protein